MHIPVTDAFDDTDQFKSLEVELTTEQIDWLREKAEKQNLSLNHVLRSMITAQMRSEDEYGKEPYVPSASGDGQPVFSSASAEESTDDVGGNGSSSIVESLRSANERLQDLTEQDDIAESSTPADTLERLQARLGNTSDADDAEDDAQGSYVVENQNRSMFDMMDE